MKKPSEIDDTMTDMLAMQPSKSIFEIARKELRERLAKNHSPGLKPEVKAHLEWLRSQNIID